MRRTGCVSEVFLEKSGMGRAKAGFAVSRYEKWRSELPLPVSWLVSKSSLTRAVHLLKSGMDPKNHISRLAGTTTGHRTKITSQLVIVQLESRERSASFKRWDLA